MKARRFADRLADGASPNFWLALVVVIVLAIGVAMAGGL